MQKVEIQTPEQIQFSYELAGLGSRFIATFVDTLIQGAAIALIQLGLLLFPQNLLDHADTLFSQWGVGFFAAVGILSSFLLFWGYYIFFETAWNGRTPGKKVVGIRVIKDGGYAVTFSDVAIRNILRIVDFLPGFYGVGILFVFFHEKNKRVGDLAAGTVVVKERGSSDAPLLELDKGGSEEDSLADLSAIQTSVAGLSLERYNLIREFLIRREELELAPRIALAKKIAVPILEEMGMSMPEGVSFEELLEGMAREYRKQKHE